MEASDDRASPEAGEAEKERELTTEEDARLMIATERVRKLMPRFGAEEMETWASLMEGVQRAEALREEVRALLSE